MCNHILGIAISKLMDKDGNQRLEWKDEILASNVDWKGDGLINTWWEGTVYIFCPMCGAHLGKNSVGLRPLSNK